MEVADASLLAFDRTVKVPLYARTRVSELWLVDLEGEQVEVRRNPSAQGYRSVQVYGRGDRLTVGALPDLEIAVEAILG